MGLPKVFGVKGLMERSHSIKAGCKYVQSSVRDQMWDTKTYSKKTVTRAFSQYKYIFS